MTKKQSTDLFCYIDETGNTGLNYFDENQKNFMLGCAFSRYNFDLEFSKKFAAILDRLNVEELHAQELGSARLNECEQAIINLIEESDSRFIFVNIEKLHYLNIMIFHHLYDPGINEAATNSALAFRILRLTLSYNFSLMVDSDDRRDFWESVRDNDVCKYIEMLKRIKEKLQNSHLDYRSKELLGDAISYTIKYPKEIFESMIFNELVSPNLSAFGLLVNGLQEAFSDQAVKVESFIHDEQRQFGKFLKKQFRATSSFFIPNSRPLDVMIDLKENDVFKDADLELKPSNESYGLQLIDVVLWVFKRKYLENKVCMNEKLLTVILNRTNVVGITYDMHIEELQGLQKDLYLNNRFLTPEKMNSAKELIKEVESTRWKEKENK